MQGRSSFLLLLGLIFQSYAPMAFAFNVDQHFELTKLAAKIARLNSFNAEVLAWSCHDEDVAPKRLFERVTHWHFFSDKYYTPGYFKGVNRPNPVGTLASLVADKTIGKIELSIKEMLAHDNGKHPVLLVTQNTSSKDFTEQLLSKLGRGVHFIQDAVVPAHAVPIYHGPRLPFVETGLAGFGSIKDPLDEAEVTTFSEAELDSIKDEVQKLTAVYSKNHSDLLEQMIKENIAFSLQKLEQNIPGHPSLKWDCFFLKPVRGEFFGRYLLDDLGHPYFKPTVNGYTAYIKEGSRKLTIPPEIVKDFIHTIQRQAILSTALYLVLYREYFDVNKG